MSFMTAVTEEQSPPPVLRMPLVAKIQRTHGLPVIVEGERMFLGRLLQICPAPCPARQLPSGTANIRRLRKTRVCVRRNLRKSLLWANNVRTSIVDAESILPKTPSPSTTPAQAVSSPQG
jgi:hypothetical protein